MQASTAPKVTAVAVVATQPTEADRVAIAHLSVEASRALAPVTYVVEVRLKTMPPATSQGWALYVGDLRIPKYWEYKGGIYFKVFDPQFFADHKGDRLRFSMNGSEFVDTGKKLPATSRGARAVSKRTRLPLQSKVLK